MRVKTYIKHINKFLKKHNFKNLKKDKKKT